MAHAVHLEDEEMKLFKERGTSVAHCPASNTMLSSGFCDVLRLIKNGVKVGLGTGNLSYYYNRLHVTLY